MSDVNSVLFAAVTKLRDKVVAASESAKPEELAYLATAIEKIGGRISLFEVADAAGIAKAEALSAIASEKLAASTAITEVKNIVLSELSQARAAAVTAAQSDMDLALNGATGSLDSHIEAFNSAKSDAISQVEAAILNLNAAIDQAVSNAQSVAATLVAQQNLSRVCMLFYTIR